MAISQVRSRFFGGFVMIGVGAVVFATIAAGLALRASLPRLEGEIRVNGLAAEVAIERDAAGVPSVTGENRLDVARALGFLHAQERFFQMDLQRRRASGELAELFGEAAVSWDARVRQHRLGRVAREVVAAAGDEESALLDAYAEGVNAGLEDLEGRPFEYILLRARPRPWRPEDSVLTLLSMYFELTSWTPEGELAHAALADLLPPELFRFLAAPGTPFDAPMVGPAFATPPAPGPEILDLREAEPAATREPVEDALEAGSNGWAVAGSRTVHGGALLASDMHLGLGLPHVWYRASLAWPEDRWGGEVVHLTGVTLPGLPLVVAGSNGRIAWGFTNSYGDWSDVVSIDPVGFVTYIGPEGPEEYEVWSEEILVAGSEPTVVEFKATRWGPLVGEDHLGRPVALRWIAHYAEAVGGPGMRLLETARDVAEAVDAAPSMGIPPQNLMVADSRGSVGWTIVGRIPRRVGCGESSGRIPSEPTCEWRGWVEAGDYPRVIDPPSGQVWTANARVVDGEWLRVLGDGGYALGARSAQIRDALDGMTGIDEQAMYSLQLDNRALFLQWWRELFLEVLDGGSGEDGRWDELREVVENWSGRAAVDDAGYRMVRAFRLYATPLVLEGLTAPCASVETPCSWEYLGQREGAVRRLLVERPPHLLNPEFSDWSALLSAAADRVTSDFSGGGSGPADHTWGKRNTVRIRHPMSGALPDWIARRIDMPVEELPGDSHMPLVQGLAFGASERIVVSPGREAEGICTMPGGQSGHPLSPYYGAGHGAWARGKVAPFLPGRAVYALVLRPL